MLTAQSAQAVHLLISWPNVADSASSRARLPAPDRAADGAWLLGRGVPVASARADAVTYMRALAGRDPDIALTRVTVDQTALAWIRQARIPF